ncbi:hypothetical protein WKV44_05025 [Spirochaetia bacterium 38H-sp]|uniref:Uncharacterized protein n=1 Tax=Rarispira pelagica TaxID=3141764 RepID=A0ABU9UB59_9SPIR
MRRFLLFFLIICVSLPVFSADPDYEPYSDGEFPLWAVRLRRFEIISFGIFPFSLFFSQFGYSFYRYANSGFDYSYAPAPFGPPGGADFSDAEHQGIILGAAVLSLIAALVDNLIVYSSFSNDSASLSSFSVISSADNLSYSDDYTFSFDFGISMPISSYFSSIEE